MKQSFSFDPLNGTFGALVSGIDLTDGFDDEDVTVLQDALFEHSVLILQQQDITAHNTPPWGWRSGNWSRVIHSTLLQTVART